MTAEPGNAHLDRAAHWLSIGRPERALRELSTGDFSPPARLLRGAALIGVSRYPAAIDELRAALADGGIDVAVLNLLTLAHCEAGDLVAAERAALAGLAEAPEHLGLLCNYGLVCLYAGDSDKAARLAATAERSHGPANPALRLRMDIAMADGRTAEAERLGKVLLARRPEGYVEQAGAAAVAWQRAEVRSAAGVFARLAAEHPDRPATVEAAVESRVAAHPAMSPMWLLQRFNPYVPWVVAVVAAAILRLLGWDVAAAIVVLVVVLYVGYGWLVGAILRRRLYRRLR